MKVAQCSCFHVANTFEFWLFFRCDCTTVFTGGKILSQVDLETGAGANGAG